MVMGEVSTKTYKLQWFQGKNLRKLENFHPITTAMRAVDMRGDEKKGMVMVVR